MYRAPRGTRDVLPQEQPYWAYIRHRAANICSLHGYQRIDTPTFEDSGLFTRSIGTGTDIVEKEMYSFRDRSRDDMTLRPEGTAPVCRAYIEHGMHTLSQPVRLYYLASIFRHERPQAGRLREHHQFGAEAIGDADPALDADVIDLSWRVCSSLGLTGLALYLNSIGCKGCRQPYLDALRSYYGQQRDRLCADCKRRLETNTLRLLDCKNEQCTLIADKAPRSADSLCRDCADHFERLKSYLNVLGLPFSLRHRLVRGLDYYDRTVFELTPEGESGSQAAIAGGGRYDGLIEELGGRPTPAVGFGTGIERLIMNLQKQRVEVPEPACPEVFIAYLGEEAKTVALRLAAFLRDSGRSTLGIAGERSLKSQLKRADAAGSKWAVIIGEDEVRNRTVVVRDMSTGLQVVKPFHLESLAGLSADELLSAQDNRE